MPANPVLPSHTSPVGLAVPMIFLMVVLVVLTGALRARWTGEPLREAVVRPSIVFGLLFTGAAIVLL